MKKAPVFLALFVLGLGCAQPPPTPLPRLTLQDAVAMALQNHPQVLVAQNEVSVSNQQVVEARAPYYPTVSLDLTGSGANDNARIGAGFLADSRLFDRFGQGITFDQLITDLGRTRNLVASSRLQSQATTQTYQATRYDVTLQVNRAYFDVLHSQALVKVAQETVSARQLLEDQVNALATNNLRSQLDVTFADVNVSEAKLLLLRAQDSVQEAFAELARSMGSELPANFQLVDEALPSGPPATANDLLAQAINNRPELASLRYSRDSAYKFYEAEKDLSRPTISFTGVAGFLPLIVQEGSTPIPNEYEGAAVNFSYPIMNGHLFTARREAARYRAQEADQKVRDEQERVVRDVKVAWSAAVNAFQRIDVTAQFLRQAALSLDLAQGRYNLGLASIVELTQAQLNQTQAEIENLSAKYDYQTQYSVLQYTVGNLR